MPRCCLCNEEEFSSLLNYVACEVCGDWFHGDALDLSGVNICRLVGFKCHKCLDKKPPLCPHLDARSNEESTVMVSDNDTKGISFEGREPQAISSKSLKIDILLNDNSKALISVVQNGELQKSGAICNSEQTLSLHAENDDVPSSLEQGAEAVQDLSVKDILHPDGFLTSKVLTSVKEDTVSLCQPHGESTNAVEMGSEFSKLNKDDPKELSSSSHGLM